MSVSLKLRIAGSATLAGLYFLAPPFSFGGAWGQYLTRGDFTQSRTAPTTEFQVGGTTHPRAFVLQPATIHSPAPPILPIVMPVADPNSALGSALASCDKLSEGFAAPAFPGARGEVKFDRCYRGRGHLICSFSALLTEARSLLESHKSIIDANYPSLDNIEDVCRIQPGTLATDLESATDFSARFTALKTQYSARISCASSVQQSFRDITLSDMAQAPDLLKSMIDTIEGDMAGVSVAQAEVAGLAEKVNASQRAMNTIQKVHRAMCAESHMETENRAAR